MAIDLENLKASQKEVGTGGAQLHLGFLLWVEKQPFQEYLQRMFLEKRS
jgi:hypothetical protein